MQPASTYCWHGIPFIRLLVPLVTGILLGDHLHPALAPLLITTVFFLLLFIFTESQSPAKRYMWRWISGISLTILLIVLGCLLISRRYAKEDATRLLITDSASGYFTIRIEDVLSPGTGTDRYIAGLRSRWDRGNWTNAAGNILVSVRKDSNLHKWEPGQILLIHKNPQRIRNDGNPGSFSFRQYYARQGIYYQLYLDPADYKMGMRITDHSLQEQLRQIRNRVIQTLRTLIPGERERGLAEALLIGYRNDLDRDLVKSYSRMGVVHIIAISGLHLGMLYGLLLLCIRPLRKRKEFRWIKPLILLSVLWFFSLLAGAAPSILRSALMFSFIIIGESLNRKIHTYHSLTASAFCLLVMDPYYLWDTGFQLSYAAVTGIILLWKPIYKLICIRNRLLSVVWQMQSITLSAQVFTLPITLYYFHQFPNFFMFTNAIAVPLSGYILYGELVLLLFCKIPVLNIYTGKMLSGLIRGLNDFIQRSDRIPFALTENIRIGFAETLLLYAILITLLITVLKRTTRGLFFTLGFVLTLFILRTIILYRFHTQYKLIVYNIPGREVIDIYEGYKYLAWGEDAQKVTDWQKNNILSVARREYGIKRSFGKDEKPFGHHLYRGLHRTVLHIDRYFPLPSLEKRIPVDLIILGTSQPYTLSRIAAVFDCKQYIFTAGNPLWKIRYWKKEADSLHLRHHTISEQGALEMDL